MTLFDFATILGDNRIMESTLATTLVGGGGILGGIVIHWLIGVLSGSSSGNSNATQPNPAPASTPAHAPAPSTSAHPILTGIENFLIQGATNALSNLIGTHFGNSVSGAAPMLPASQTSAK